MGDFSISVLVERSQRDVFDFMTDPTNLPKWNGMCESAEWLSSDPPGVGSTYRWVKTTRTNKEAIFEIVEWDPPRRYCYRADPRMFPLKLIRTFYTFEPEDGGTRLTMNGHFELVGALRFLEGLLAKLGTNGDMKFLLAAKRVLESEGDAR
jgi:uncharacterized protein YndB with AHSA1/START domain